MHYRQECEELLTLSLGEDSDNQKNSAAETYASGVEAIFSLHNFSNKASSIYISSIRSYLDQELPSSISQLILEQDYNLFYSINSSALWLLLKTKLKKLSQYNLFENSRQRSIFNFILNYASIWALNDAKEKIVSAQNRQPLRDHFREHVNLKIKQEIRRVESMRIQFSQSDLLNNKIRTKMNISGEQFDSIKQKILRFQFPKDQQMRIFLQKILSHLQRTIHGKQVQLKLKSSTIESSNHTQVEGPYRQAINIILICNYLNNYVCRYDWLNNVLMNRNIENLLYSNIAKRKGIHIIHRVLDDAPIKVIFEEILKIQSLFGKK